MAAQGFKRTPRNYDSTGLTAHRMCDLLPAVLKSLQSVHNHRPDLVLAAWPEVIGGQIAAMTRAESFVGGLLTVKVANSTLHSLLSRNDKAIILAKLRNKFPAIEIKNIIFRIG